MMEYWLSLSKLDLILFFLFLVFNATFSNISANHGDQIEWLKKQVYPERAMDKQLVNFSTCGCESNAPFL